MASEKIVKFVEEIKTLTVLELADLVKAIEEEFGVLLPLLRRKLSLMLFWLRLVLPRWA